MQHNAFEVTMPEPDREDFPSLCDKDQIFGGRLICCSKRHKRGDRQHEANATSDDGVPLRVTWTQ